MRRSPAKKPRGKIRWAWPLRWTSCSNCSSEIRFESMWRHIEFMGLYISVVHFCRRCAPERLHVWDLLRIQFGH